MLKLPETRFERHVMHAADATHRPIRSLFGKIEKCELIAATYVEEDMSGSRIVAILDDARQAHPHTSV